MRRTPGPALAAGYAVAFAVVLLGLIAAFGYLGPLEVLAAAVLAVPVTAGGARLLDPEAELDLDLDPLLDPEAAEAAEVVEPAPAPAS